MFRVRLDGLTLYLVYLDDGGKAPVNVFGGIVVPHGLFHGLETFNAFLVWELLTDEQRERFDEFHASDLFAGTGVFEGIAEERRHETLRQLISLRGSLNISYIYSAVATRELQRGPVKSASWIDIAFSMCARAIDQHIWAEHMRNLKAWRERSPSNVFNMPESPLSLMIIDDVKDRDKGLIKATFRSMRKRISQAERTEGNQFSLSNQLGASVDQVLFGASSDSIGLQIADACNWAMWKRLCDEDEGRFFEALSTGPIICAKPEPEWTQYRHLLRSHD